MPTTIKNEFDKLIRDVFPSGHNGGCSLTAKQKRRAQSMFFAGYRSCFTAIMLNGDRSEAEAAKQMDATVAELDEYFKGSPQPTFYRN